VLSGGAAEPLLSSASYLGPPTAKKNTSIRAEDRKMEFLGKKGREGKRTGGARTRWGAGQPGGHTTGDAAGTADLPKGRAAWSRKVNKELGAEGTRGVRARGTPRSNSRRKQRASGMCELKTEAESKHIIDPQKKAAVHQ
jgi:hypothetical protein